MTNPSGLQIIEALAPRVSRYAEAMASAPDQVGRNFVDAWGYCQLCGSPVEECACEPLSEADEWVWVGPGNDYVNMGEFRRAFNAALRNVPVPPKAEEFMGVASMRRIFASRNLTAELFLNRRRDT